MSKPIYILCLHGVRTGGPEAIHQLSDALITQGFDARMVYYDWAQIAALEGMKPQPGYLFGQRTNPIENYAHYAVNVTDRIPNEEGVIVVLPETLCHLAPLFDKASVLIWWLSVDNGFGALAKVNLNHLRKPGVQHAAQSVYANRFIVSLGLTPAPGAFRTDYTADMREIATPKPRAERLQLALFNANHKVVDDLQSIFDEVARLDPSISCQALHHMPRASLAELLSVARLYVDLGCMPGKDRLPREAWLMGCDVLTSSHYGAGDEFFATKIEGREEAAPNIVAMMQRDDRFHSERGVLHIEGERTVFFREAKAIFSEL